MYQFSTPITDEMRLPMLYDVLTPARFPKRGHMQVARGRD